MILCVPVAGETRSEGGFKSGKVSSAALLDVQEANDKSGKPYYKYEILTRTGARLFGHELSRNKHFCISYMRCSSTRLRVARAANIFLPSATALHARLPLQLC